MTDLRRYSDQDIADLGSALLDEIALGVMDRQWLEGRLQEFKFRDAEGHYWAYGPRSRDWRVYSARKWQSAQPPDSRLEGADALIELVPEMAHPPSSMRPAEEGSREDDPVAGFKGRMDAIRTGYEQGRLNSAAVEQLAGEVFLIDRELQLWTVGARSGTWYRRGDGKWIFARQGPSADSLLDTEAEDSRQAVEDAFMEFIVNEGDPLPEPVAGEWSPPAGLAEAVYQCPACSKVDTAVGEKCRFCGTETSTQAAPPAASAAKFCGHCGSPVSAGMKFCTHCGGKL